MRNETTHPRERKLKNQPSVLTLVTTDRMESLDLLEDIGTTAAGSNWNSEKNVCEIRKENLPAEETIKLL